MNHSANGLRANGFREDGATMDPGIYHVCVRFPERPSDPVFEVLRGRGFVYAHHAWHGQGVPQELAGLVRCCDGIVELEDAAVHRFPDRDD